MADPTTDRLERELAADPSSPVFMELAEALIAQGELQRAAAVCQSGVQHHPHAVVGWVLWGKALIQAGKPAEAMERFDKAIAVERDKPLAYNLIGEILLKKGLYRSALPILKKAAALQPGDGRARQWLEQAQQALADGKGASRGAGGRSAPAPALNTSEQQVAERALEPTLVQMAASRPEPSALGGPAWADFLPPGLDAEAGGRPDEDAASFGQAAPSISAAHPARRADSSAPAGSVLDDLHLALQGDDSPPTIPMVTAKPPPLPPPPPRAPPRAPPRRPGLLDLPDAPPPTAHVAVESKAQVGKQEVEAIARAYERELSEKLLAPEKSSFWRRHGMWIGSVAVLGAVLTAAVLTYVSTRRANRAGDLAGDLTRAKKAITLDTVEGYEVALAAASDALDLDADNTEAFALRAYAEALLFKEHGGEARHRTEALASLERPGVREGFPQWTLPALYYLAEGARAREEAAQQVLARQAMAAELLEPAGRVLLERGKVEEALARFQKALDTQRGHVRTLLDLADYYRTRGESQKALEFFEAAKGASPSHVLALFGAAEAKVVLSQDVEQAKGELEKLDELFQREPPPPGLKGRLDLAIAKAYVALGDKQKAIARLAASPSPGGKGAGERLATLGEMYASIGALDKAEEAYAKAASGRDADPAAKEALARVLIARGKYREALSKTEPPKDDRRLHLVRGVARMELGEYEKARGEFSATKRDGKIPAEAAIYLAIADIRQGQKERARAVLQKAVARPKPTALAQTAMAILYTSDGQIDLARKGLEAAAAAEPKDHEALCLLGRLEIGEGHPAAAAKALKASIERNGFHAEARRALGQASLLGGDPKASQQAYAAVLGDAPSDAEALRGMARALAADGKAPDAKRYLVRALKVAPGEPETWRTAGLVSLAAGDVGEGLKHLEKVTKRPNPEPSVFCELGMARLFAGEEPKAKEAFEAALKLKKEIVCGRVGKAFALAALGNKEQAKELQPLLRAQTEDAPPAELAFSRAALARAELAAGKAGPARKEAEKAVEADPKLGLAHYVLALSLNGKGTGADKAAKAFEEATALSPALAVARLALAQLCAQSPDKYSKAIVEYQAYLKAAPKGPGAEAAKKALSELRKKAAGK